MGKNFSANNQGQRKENDFYPTHYSLTWQLFEKDSCWSPEKSVLEPCAGKGAIVTVLKNHFINITSYDLMGGINFFDETRTYNFIITNPPFKKSINWMKKCKQVATDKFALLLPLSHLQGITRLNEVYSDKVYPLEKVLIFSRYPMLGTELRDDGKYKTGMMVLAWYIWNKSYKGSPTIDWIDNQRYILNSKDLK